jgi:signal transduction histidine kinase
MGDGVQRLLGSVRLRTTLAATVVTGVAVLLAAVWLVRSVEQSLEGELQAADEACTVEIGRLIRSGVPLPDIEASSPCDYFQVIAEGKVLAAAPGLAGYPPLEKDGGRSERLDTIGPISITSVQVSGPGGLVQVYAASPLLTVRKSVQTVEAGLSIILPMLVALVGAVAWVLTGRALRPVEAIRTEVEEITATTLHRRVPEPAARDEVARLARTMNAMLDRLEEAAARQQQFISDASHELRSPVASIRTELEVALRTGDQTDWNRTATNLLAEEARLEAIIADLLLLASLNEADALAGATEVDASEVVAEEAARPRRDDLAIEVDAPALVLVRGKRVQLARAIGNLLDNASRHAAHTIRMSANERNGRVRIIVDDDGPGIPIEERERVFERFTRLEASRRRDAGGSGLGLALVRRIAELHGGTVIADTSPLGGARLILDLPAAAEMASDSTVRGG